MARSHVLLPALVLTALVLCRCRPPAGDADISLGVSASQKGQWEEAIALWTKVLAFDPSSAAAHNNLAVAYEKKGLRDEARREYESALKLAPDDPRIKENYVRFLEYRTAPQVKAGPERTPPPGVRP
jgi:Tfp pilus assembly protein PilF